MKELNELMSNLETEHYFLSDRSNFETYVTTLIKKIINLISDNNSHILTTTNTNDCVLSKDYNDPLNKVIENIILKYLNNTLNPYSGLLVCNVVPPVTLAASLAKIACAIINPCLDAKLYAGDMLQAEQKSVQILAELFGYNSSNSAGYFTNGGAFNNYWSLRYAIEKHVKEFAKKGFNSVDGRKIAIVQTYLGHYSIQHAARLLGIGTENVIKVKIGRNLGIDIHDFEQKVINWINKGYDIIHVYLIAGATDTFAVDNIKDIYAICQKIFLTRHLTMPHIHIDAAVGWVYKFLDDYCQKDNYLNLNNHLLNVIKNLNSLYANFHYADSISSDLHKHGYGAYNASTLILKNKEDLHLIQKGFDETPHYNEELFKSFPAAYTNENSRASEGPLMLLANLEVLGKKGYQKILIKCITKTTYIKLYIETNFKENMAVINLHIPGSSCVWRIYPAHMGDATELLEMELSGSLSEEIVTSINKYNLNIFNEWQKIRKKDDPILGFSKQAIWTTTEQGIAGFKCIILNPNTEVNKITSSLYSILELSLDKNILSTIPVKNRNRFFTTHENVDSEKNQNIHHSPMVSLTKNIDFNKEESNEFSLARIRAKM